MATFSLTSAVETPRVLLSFSATPIISTDTAGVPFACIGGMTQVAQFLVKTVLLGRLNGQYALNALEHAHGLIVCSAGVGLAQGDPVKTMLEWCRNQRFTAQDLNAAVSSKLSASTVKPASWVPAPGAGRRTDTIEALKAMDRAQLKASIAEQELLARFNGPHQPPLTLPLPTGVVGVVAMRLERLEGMYIRSLYKDEMVVLLLKLHENMTSVHPDLTSIRASGLSPAERVVHAHLTAATTMYAHKTGAVRGAIKTLWEDASLETHPLLMTKDKGALSSKVQQLDDSQQTAVELTQMLRGMCNAGAQLVSSDGGDGTDAPPCIKVVHVTVVFAHEEFPGAGNSMLTQLTAMADASGHAIFLESMLQNGLPLFTYAKHGFIPVMASKTAAERLKSSTLEARGWVHMYRPAGAAAGASAAAIEGKDEFDIWASIPIAECMQYKMVDNSAASRLHLSDAATALFHDYFQQTAKVARVKEMARQLLSRELQNSELLEAVLEVVQPPPLGGPEDDDDGLTLLMQQQATPERHLRLSDLGLTSMARNKGPVPSFNLVRPPYTRSELRALASKPALPSEQVVVAAADDEERPTKRVRIEVDGMTITVQTRPGSNINVQFL